MRRYGIGDGNEGGLGFIRARSNDFFIQLLLQSKEHDPAHTTTDRFSRGTEGSGENCSRCEAREYVVYIGKVQWWKMATPFKGHSRSNPFSTCRRY